ncbi:hypothetical protein A2215_03935 [Candidatus Berkelbacteria bacterium RIFOXYA2_FULL_43_10]|uniref:Restriction endonuclease type IV Mrr domain-containing protein n=1 Tax=Candidatus Berkelbacteria bacterium RIFOXYA2_FULL_43_10 TaxID=1797472 RepID=A0A1F5E4C1_9BACT|nr:MAG: hypothetical protein A2215_03935 [Candidatus Berkelbacteria bacterium RIFOXYA2_FULL_43_10]
MEITETFVVNKIKEKLGTKWKVIFEPELHERGCDIILRDELNKHKARRFLIECKGKSYAKNSRSVNETIWLFALGQLITRMSVIAKHAYLYGLGLPEASAQKALRRIPWQAAKHLCLHIFSVDDNGAVTKYLPKDFKVCQKKKNR